MAGEIPVLALGLAVSTPLPVACTGESDDFLRTKIYGR